MKMNCLSDKDFYLALKQSIRDLRRELRLNKVAMISNAVPSCCGIKTIFPDLCLSMFVAETDTAKTEILFRLQYYGDSVKVTFNVTNQSFLKVLLGRCYAIVDVSGSDKSASEELLERILEMRERINNNRNFLLITRPDISLSSVLASGGKIIAFSSNSAVLRIDV